GARVGRDRPRGGRGGGGRGAGGRPAHPALAAGPLLYARVDLALDTAGAPVVMELELIEPNLFLTATEGGVDRFVEAVARL
ncbi:hypothetical protein ACFXPJ_37935, partial [Streptomyces goshikiensis]